MVAGWFSARARRISSGSLQAAPKKDSPNWCTNGAGSVAEDVAQLVGLDESGPPFQEPVRIGLAHSTLAAGIDGAELLLKQAQQEASFTFLPPFLPPFLPALLFAPLQEHPAPVFDLLFEHACELLHPKILGDVLYFAPYSRDPHADEPGGEGVPQTSVGRTR